MKRGPKPTDFWSLVDKGEACWRWLGRLNRDGYGECWINGRSYMAHRWAWMLTGGALPPGAILMHSCDVPSCVNPSHLRVGTHADNQADKVAKKRQAIGGSVHNAILTSEAVLAIRAEYRRQSRVGATDGNANELAARHGVKPDTIRRVARRQLWGHVK